MNTITNNKESWRPILLPSESESQRGWNTVKGISGRLAAGDGHSSREGAGRLRFGESLLCGYLAGILVENEWLNLAAEQLNESINAAVFSTDYALHGGLCGLGWTVEHLSSLPACTSEMGDEQANRGSLADSRESQSSDLNSDLDTFLVRELASSRWSGPYDLASGLIGLGVYFLERLPAEKAVLGVQFVLYHLDQDRIWTCEDRTWGIFCSKSAGVGDPMLLGPSTGIAAVVHFLSQASAAGIDKDRADRLLECATSRLLAERQSGVRVLDHSIGIPGGPESADLSWCQGQLGLVAVLLQAAKRAARSDWQQYGEGMLEECIFTASRCSTISDVSLCYGASGVAHMFNRIYQYQGIRLCLDIALEWFDRVLSVVAVPGCLNNWTPITDQPTLRSPRRHRACSFASGEVGVALTLLAALTATEPNWDRLLLLSGRDWSKVWDTSAA